MKTKLISLLAALLCLAICLVPLASCDDESSTGETTKEPVGTSAPDTSVPDTSTPDTQAPETSTPDTSAPETSAPETSAPDTQAPDTSAPDTSEPENPGTGISKSEWEAMLSDENFTNYTLTLEGRMTVTQDGKDQGTSDISETIKVTADKVEITAFAADTGSDTSDSFTILVEGEEAKGQMSQYTQIFMPILREYESFVYDPQTGTYSIPNTVELDIILTGLSYDSEGNLSTFDVPAHLIFREASATLSEDGKLLTFVCDYTQTMTMSESVISTSGQTTWTFSDYGTTVITATESDIIMA